MCHFSYHTSIKTISTNPFPIIISITLLALNIYVNKVPLVVILVATFLQSTRY